MTNPQVTTSGRLFVLEASGNRIFSVNADGTDRKILVTDCRLPDGIAVDIGFASGITSGAAGRVPGRHDGARA